MKIGLCNNGDYMDFEILENLKSPEQIKTMSNQQLLKLADELRQALIYNISCTGGQ